MTAQKARAVRALKFTPHPAESASFHAKTPADSGAQKMPHVTRGGSPEVGGPTATALCIAGPTYCSGKPGGGYCIRLEPCAYNSPSNIGQRRGRRSFMSLFHQLKDCHPLLTHNLKVPWHRRVSHTCASWCVGNALSRDTRRRSRTPQKGDLRLHKRGSAPTGMGQVTRLVVFAGPPGRPACPEARRP